jgi:class 3 adenylate cyclase
MAQELHLSEYKTTILEKTEREMTASDYLVGFSGLAKSYCVGIVDMCNSTKISANMNEKDWSKYYGTFLNSMARMIPKFGGVALKNGGDSLLFYFPESSKPRRKFGFISCIECSLNMLEAHDSINESLTKEGLPNLDYRVSSDFGKVVLMKAENQMYSDLVGPPVNMCSKINRHAQTNGYVIGGDFHEHVKSLNDYGFHQEKGFSIGLKYSYPVYSIDRSY